MHSYILFIKQVLCCSPALKKRCKLMRTVFLKSCDEQECPHPDTAPEGHAQWKTAIQFQLHLSSQKTNMGQETALFSCYPSNTLRTTQLEKNPCLSFKINNASLWWV